MNSRKRYSFAAYGVALVAMAAGAQADFITGYGWVSTDAIAGSATGGSPASLLLSTCSHGTATCTPADADVSFTTTGVDFPSQGSGTIAAWLTSSGFPLDNLVDTAPTTALSPTLWEFVGNISVTNGETFTFGHDDGVTFIVNGQTVVNQPGPTGFVNTPGSYTGATSNNAPFTLVYSECCGGGAGLVVSLLGPGSAPPSGVPEPTTIGLVGAGLGAVVLRRRGLKRLNQ